MKPYYDDGQATIYHADVRNLIAGDLGQAACVVTSPAYNMGVAYDCWDNSLPDDNYDHLAVGASKLIGDLLTRLAGRAWVNVGVSRFHTWLDALQVAGLAERHVVCWDYGIATADTEWDHGNHLPLRICATAGKRSSWLPRRAGPETSRLGSGRNGATGWGTGRSYAVTSGASLQGRPPTAPTQRSCQPSWPSGP